MIGDKNLSVWMKQGLRKRESIITVTLDHKNCTFPNSDFSPIVPFFYLSKVIAAIFQHLLIKVIQL